MTNSCGAGYATVDTVTLIFKRMREANGGRGHLATAPRSFAALTDTLIGCAQSLLRIGHQSGFALSPVVVAQRCRAKITRTPTTPNRQRRLESSKRDVIDLTKQTELKQSLPAAKAESKRVARVATVSVLTAFIRHEISQPFTCFMASGYASQRWHSMQPPDLEEARRALAEVVREADRAFKVIARIHERSRKQPFGHLPVDINQVTLQVLALTSNALKSSGVTVQREFAHDLPVIHGNPDDLRQAILELVKNAIDAMGSIVDRPRRLLTKTAIDSVGVVVQVRDSGVGIQSRLSQLIFEPFFTTKPHALGLGLSISRSIIEAPGGLLWTTADDLNGTVFQFTLSKARDSR
jgi:C4-dicarboxylate-specific signal transduction histidine kinase